MRSILFLFLCFPIFIFGQVTTPTVITNSGGTFSNSSVIMDFSIGELAVQTLQNNEILTLYDLTEDEIKIVEES